MKHLILWGSLLIVCIILTIVYEKTTVMTFIDNKTSPIYVDVVWVLILTPILIGKLLALYSKLFK